MVNDEAAQQFRDIVNQYSQQMGTETATYLVQTYQLGDRDVAFNGLVGSLVELGYNEDQLVQGPLARLAQALQIDTTQSVPADPSAVRWTGERPDPFAAAVAESSRALGLQPPASNQSNNTVQTQPPAGTPPVPTDLPAVSQPQPSQIIQPSVAPAQPPNEDGVLHVH